MKITINELSKRINMSNGAVRNWCLKINVGDTFTENYCNIENVKTMLLKTFNNDTKVLNEKLGFDYNEIEIIRSERKESKYIGNDDLEVNKNYILRHYHYEKEVTFIDQLDDEDDTTLYLFKTLDNKYEVYSLEQFDDDNLHIKEVE